MKLQSREAQQTVSYHIMLQLGKVALFALQNIAFIWEFMRSFDC